MEGQINDEYDNDVEVHEKLKRLMMRLRNMGKNEEERQRLIGVIRGLLKDNSELLRLMKQHIDASDHKGHEFEMLYKAMIESEDYANRKPNNEKKLPKLHRIKQDTGKYSRLRDDALHTCNKFSEDYLEGLFEIDELEAVVGELTNLNKNLKDYVKILLDIVKYLDRRRIKTQDAEIRKNTVRHTKLMDEIAVI